MKRKNDLGFEDQLAALAKREAGIRAKMALLREQGRRREQKNVEQEQGIVGMAVIAAAALSPEFKLAVSQIALIHVSDEKQRRFLADRGWNV
jgi:hypothetical protein